MAGDTSQKTEKPTPKRLREAREKGQVAKTPELAAWAGLLIAISLIESMLKRGTALMQGMLHDMAHVVGNPDEGDAKGFFGHAMKDSLVLMAPLLLGLTLVVIVVTLPQVGLKPSMKRLKPDFKRLNVLTGIKNLFGAKSAWEMAKALIKTVILTLVAWPVVSAATVYLATHGGSLETIVGTTAHAVVRIARNIAGAGLVLAAVDYGVQRRRIMKELRMSKQEIKEEFRNSEGDPRVRQQIRSRQAAMTRNRMINMVSAADVVLVNPTHYAVALRYQQGRGAPEVIAKGAGAIALKIRERAEEHGVPIVREPLLCRTIFRACDIGQVIPVELYEAVAQVLAFVFTLKAKGRSGGFHEMEPLLT